MFRRIQQQAAFIEFSLQNFDEARELFKSGQVDIREVLFVIMMFFCSSVVLFSPSLAGILTPEAYNSTNRAISSPG